MRRKIFAGLWVVAAMIDEKNVVLIYVFLALLMVIYDPVFRKQLLESGRVAMPVRVYYLNYK